MMYFVTRIFFDQTGKQSNSIQMFTDLTLARKRFYSILAADIDQEQYQFELVQIVDENGLTLATQTFDNRIQPEPEVEG